jgi:hypothetical protein
MVSGGSYNYVCFKGGEELLSETHDRDLEDMTNRLAGLGYAADAAEETAALLAELRAARARVNAKTKRLSEIWHAVEWWDSGDTGEWLLKEELAKYRGEEVPPRPGQMSAGGSASSPAPVQLLFGQPWHMVKEQLPASLVDEMDGWIASKEPNMFPPDGLVEKLYRAYLKAKIEVFPR